MNGKNLYFYVIRFFYTIFLIFDFTTDLQRRYCGDPYKTIKQ